MTRYLKYHRVNSFLFFIIILIYLGLTLIMTGCNGTSTQVPTPEDPRLVDQSFVTGQPCQAPCWYGIEPGQSNQTEALNKLNTLSFVDNTKIRISKNVRFFDYLDVTEIDFNCVFPNGKMCGFILSVNDIVKSIYIYIQYPLPLKSAIDKLGAPDYFLYNPYSPHGDGCMVSFHWPKKRITLINVDYYSQQICQDIEDGKVFNPDILITEVQYESEEIASRDVCEKRRCMIWPGFLDK